MGEEIMVNFSMFENRLSPVAMACFRVLFGKARDTVSQDGPRKTYETPVDGLLAASGADDLETAAQSIRDIIQCRLEIKKGKYLYFIPFFTSVSIESGAVRYSLPTELESVIASVTLPCPD